MNRIVSLLRQKRGAAMLVNMIIVALVMGLMATSFAQLSSGQFASADAYRTSYQAQQLVEAKANEIAVTSYSALAGETRAAVTGATEWQREVILGAETDLGGGNMQRPVTINVYKDAEAVARASVVKYPTSKGTASVPTGTIVIWSGSIATIPSGWQLCDGSNGTPDLRSRFVYGAGGDATTKASYVVGWNTAANGHLGIGAVGGEEMHRLTIAEMPSHTHPANLLVWGAGGSTYPAGGYGPIAPTGAAGGDAAHNILPRFIALAYIIKM